MKKKFKTEIDCAACTLKIEDAVAKVEGVEKVAIAFMAQKMTIEFAEGADVDAVTKNVVAAAKKVEPDCEIFVD
ncbi:MAG: heavy-metal-associated domain-containing protein [Schwartzia sp.]|nr:heavy-metal-associated domain-containing protein [Schwartzia sp. (in: firmicutes)]